jgi:hypothetical protein
MNTNILLGAISGNYKPSDIERWVRTSKWDGVDRVLFVYNHKENPDLVAFLKQEGITAVLPDFDFFGNITSEFTTNTGTMTVESSYSLVHNLRFFHIYQFLKDSSYEKVFMTDVKDVYFNKSPFLQLPTQGILATGEVIKYSEDPWNTRHLLTNLGLFGHALLDEEVLNVGVFGGGLKDVTDICRDIYLLSCGKPLVADQTSFNYLIRNGYADKTVVTSINDEFAVHLHVVSTGQVKFDINKLQNYTIVHQYDRL